MCDTRGTTLTITHAAGPHLSPAAVFVSTAGRFGSQITVRNLSREGSSAVDAKSMFGVMQLGVSQGHEIRVEATRRIRGESPMSRLVAVECS